MKNVSDALNSFESIIFTFASATLLIAAIPLERVRVHRESWAREQRVMVIEAVLDAPLRRDSILVGWVTAVMHTTATSTFQKRIAGCQVL